MTISATVMMWVGEWVGWGLASPPPPVAWEASSVDRPDHVVLLKPDIMAWEDRGATEGGAAKPHNWGLEGSCRTAVHCTSPRCTTTFNTASHLFSHNNPQPIACNHMQRSAYPPAPQ